MSLGTKSIVKSGAVPPKVYPTKDSTSRCRVWSGAMEGKDSFLFHSEGSIPSLPLREYSSAIEQLVYTEKAGGLNPSTPTISSR